MQRETFAGDIILFYAYDVGEDIDLEAIKAQIDGAFLQNAETLVCSGSHMVQAMDLMMISNC